ncbi:MAG: alpha/beta hydrolase [Microbacterium sp.]
MAIDALDPEVADLRRALRDAGLDGFQTTEPIEDARAQSVAARTRFYPQVGVPVASIEDVTIPTRAGAVPARVLRPRVADAPESTLPTLLYFHGGGFCLGDIDAHEAHARRLAARVGAVVVNVGYRLAPEHPFPAGADDAFAALEWAMAHVDRLGGDGRRIAVAGDSAGGNLAAVTALAAAAEGIGLAGQLLAYPVTDLSTTAPGVVERWYLGGRLDLLADPRVSPARSGLLSRVAPVVLGVGGHDFLLRDNVAFARRLEQRRVPHRIRVFPGLDHGFLSFVSVSAASARAADVLYADFRALMRVGPAALIAREP